MSQVAKLFINGRSQAVRFAGRVSVRRQGGFRSPRPGDRRRILSRKPGSWDGFLAAFQGGVAPDDFLDDRERTAEALQRDPFDGWHATMGHLRMQ